MPTPRAVAQDPCEGDGERQEERGPPDGQQGAAAGGLAAPQGGADGPAPVKADADERECVEEDCDRLGVRDEATERGGEGPALHASRGHSYRASSACSNGA